MAVNREWSVTCTDAFGRARAVRVPLSGDKVILLAPPGEAAVMTWTTTEELRRALAFAVSAALQPKTT